MLKKKHILKINMYYSISKLKHYKRYSLGVIVLLLGKLQRGPIKWSYTIIIYHIIRYHATMQHRIIFFWYLLKFVIISPVDGSNFMYLHVALLSVLYVSVYILLLVVPYMCIWLQNHKCSLLKLHVLVCFYVRDGLRNLY